MCEANLPLVDGLRFLQKSSEELKPEETYLNIYGRIIGRALRTYLEQTYNYFVEEFPPEQRTPSSILSLSL